MRFRNYLIEQDTDISEITDLIEKKCKPFLKDYMNVLKGTRGIPRYLLSGRGRKKDYFVGDIRKGRLPKDTPEEVQDSVDDKFENIFGVRPRGNSLFCNPNINFAKNYGSAVYIIFPVGDYEIIWSPEIGDFYSDLLDGEIDEAFLRDDPDEMREALANEWENQYWEEENPEIEKEEYIEQELEKWEQEQERILRQVLESYKKGNLREALLHDNEIMLMGDKYIAVNYWYYEDKIENWLINKMEGK